MKKAKKWLMSLGTIASITMPIVAAVSCGSEIVKDKDGNVVMTYEASSKTVYFNLNKEKSEQIDTSSIQLKRFIDPIFKRRGATDSPEITREDFIKMNDAFQKVTDPRFSNIKRLKNGDTVHMVITGQYKAETEYSQKAGEDFVKRPVIKINFTMKIDYTYNENSKLSFPALKDQNGRLDSTDPDQRDKERVKVRSNFLDNLIEGMKQYGMFTTASSGLESFFPTGGYWDKTGSFTNNYAHDTISTTAVLGLISNSDASVANALTNPRNYETTVTLPKMDLTGFLISKPADAKKLLIADALDAPVVTGNVTNGFNLEVPHTTIGTSSDVETFIKTLAPPNMTRGFYKTLTSTDVVWEGGKTYAPTVEHSVATVTVVGTDWNDKVIKHSYKVRVHGKQS